MKKLYFFLVFIAFFHKSESQVNGAPYCLAPVWVVCYDSITPFDTLVKYNVYYGSSMIGVQNTFYSLTNSLPHWVKYWSGSALNPPNVYSVTTPTVTATSTYTAVVMAGLAGAITPQYSGVIDMTINGLMSNGSLSDGGQVQIAYGTGTAPSNGASATGTATGSIQSCVSTTATPFSTEKIIKNLTIGTAYWVDLQFKAITGGTFTISSVTVNIKEQK